MSDFRNVVNKLSSLETKPLKSVIKESPDADKQYINNTKKLFTEMEASDVDTMMSQDDSEKNESTDKDIKEILSEIKSGIDSILEKLSTKD